MGDGVRDSTEGGRLGCVHTAWPRARQEHNSLNVEGSLRPSGNRPARKSISAARRAVGKPGKPQAAGAAGSVKHTTAGRYPMVATELRPATPKTQTSHRTSHSFSRTTHDAQVRRGPGIGPSAKLGRSTYLLGFRVLDDGLVGPDPLVLTLFRKGNPPMSHNPTTASWSVDHARARYTDGDVGVDLTPT